MTSKASRLEKEFLKQKITEGLAKGKNQRQLAILLQLSPGRISQIVKELRVEAKQAIQSYVQDELPIQYQNTLVGINTVIARLWDSIEHPSSLSEKDRNNNMSLLLQAYGMRLELLSSAETLKHTVNFVAVRTQIHKYKVMRMQQH